MKKISLLIIMTLLVNLSTLSVFSADEVALSLSDKDNYELYQERVTNYCNEYKVTDSTSELIYLINSPDYKTYTDFTDLSKLGDSNLSETEKEKLNELNEKKLKDLENAKKQYLNIMDWIYDCAVSTSYYKWYELIKEDLIKGNAVINSSLSEKIKNQQEDIVKSQWELDESTWNTCKIISESKSSIIKKSVLKQATYELCKYNYYLEYLKWINKNIEYENLDDDYYDEEQTKAINELAISSISEAKAIKSNAIDLEIENTYKVFPKVYQSYSDYENSIAIHLLLELLKDAYSLLRESLHKTINPINQVVYKISNAMKLP